MSPRRAGASRRRRKSKRRPKNRKRNNRTNPFSRNRKSLFRLCRKTSKDDQAIKLSTQVVNVDVTVIEKKTGRLISNLTKKNFTIYEDGVKQEVTNFLSGEGPMTAVLLIENNFRNRRLARLFQPVIRAGDVSISRNLCARLRQDKTIKLR